MQSILLAIPATDHLIKAADLLSNKGYCVIPGMDSRFALSVLGQGIPVDAVIADYELPDGDAPGLIRSIRSTVSTPPPVIVQSDHVDIEHYLSALSLGAFEFFFRPVRPDEFLRVLKIALSLKKREGSGAGTGRYSLQAGADRGSQSDPVFIHQ